MSHISNAICVAAICLSLAYCSGEMDKKEARILEACFASGGEWRSSWGRPYCEFDK